MVLHDKAGTHERQRRGQSGPPPHPRFRVLGVRVDAVQIPDVIADLERWVTEEAAVTHYVTVTGMHGVTEAQADRAFRQALDGADLVVPDGMPLVWLGRRAGHYVPRRVYGPELLATFCARTGSRYKHFFYGGTEEVLAKLSDSLRARHGIRVAGTFAPPFRSLRADESREIAALINRSGADVVWVGLGTPKQEGWMHEHRECLRAPVLVGVGAAFDFLSGTKRMAPGCFQEHGFEWLFRLLQEPRRLWRRYLVHGSRFVTWLVLERLGLKNFT